METHRFGGTKISLYLKHEQKKGKGENVGVGHAPLLLDWTNVIMICRKVGRTNYSHHHE